MDYFNYKDNLLHAEDCPLTDIAEQFGTPCYVYSRATLERHWHAFNDAFTDAPHLICYATKANSNLAVLNILARLGSGFDIVSGGELERVIAAGGDPSKVVFSGLGKQAWEIEAALKAGILCFNVESAPELERIAEVAQAMGKKAPISIRVNPDVDAQTHPYISTGLKENKFGIEIQHAHDLYLQWAKHPHIEIKGVDCHIGSQLTTIDPFIDALDLVLALIDDLASQGVAIEHLDIGGGLGVRYKDEQPPEPAEYAQAIRKRLGKRDLTLIMEPGRAIAANAGIFLTRVEFIKQNEEKNFAIIDGAMNDLIRPALYQAWQEIVPVQAGNPNQSPERVYDVVGPVCETGDFLGKDRSLAIQAEDLLAVRSSGAYGFVMSSNYNSRGRPPEIMIDGNRSYLTRPRETIKDQFASESLLP
ncbi:MAG: diaminopimelate decarboxylase [Gammaproteobacteria bacterium]|nr:MAG: diaminopimelate decarboxylase [Gammaproteobacteria bacterium]